MKRNNDWLYVLKIQQHFNELNALLPQVPTLAAFHNDVIARKALLFDLLQIGELLHCLSPELFKVLQPEASLVVGMRNRIAHGYGTLKDEIVYPSLSHDLPVLVKRILECAKESYIQNLLQLQGRLVRLIYLNGEDVDPGYVYGDLIAPTGHFQNAIVIPEPDVSCDCEGVVLGVVLDSSSGQYHLLVRNALAELDDDPLGSFLKNHQELILVSKPI